jgi:uncharacterized radical SAM superfamily Fe-S cluster-containing enzyme
MTEYLGTTQSLCRVCRRLIPAQVMIAGGSVWFHKICPAHGPQEARVYGDAQAYLQLPHFHRRASQSLAFATAGGKCPDNCGLCPEHEQHVCLPIIEITDYCNLACPICLVTNPGQRHLTRADVARMLDGLLRSEGQLDVINLSGGEPTVNPHFRDIVAECASRKEILRVSVSTNGLILAHDLDLLRFLADHRVIISLQYDGPGDAACQTLRGRPLLEAKLRLIESCAQLNASLSLTATVTRGVNEHQLVAIANLLFQHDHILSVMLQPAAYVGNALKMVRPADAITIPDVIAGLNGAGNGTVSPADFSPLPCSHPACFSLAFYLKIADHRYMPVKPMVNADRYLDLIQNRAIPGTDADSFALLNEAVYELWSGAAALSPDSQKALGAVKRLLSLATAGNGYSPQKALQIAERSVKSIFIHQFMDPDTFDLARARKCCQVYPQPDGRLLPACVFNNRWRGQALDV